MPTTAALALSSMTIPAEAGSSTRHPWMRGADPLAALIPIPPALLTTVFSTVNLLPRRNTMPLPEVSLTVLVSMTPSASVHTMAPPRTRLRRRNSRAPS